MHFYFTLACKYTHFHTHMKIFTLSDSSTAAINASASGDTVKVLAGWVHFVSALCALYLQIGTYNSSGDYDLTLTKSLYLHGSLFHFLSYFLSLSLSLLLSLSLSLTFSLSLSVSHELSQRRGRCDCGTAKWRKKV